MPHYGLWSWKSTGATAEYLASLGVPYGQLRRGELSVGVVAALFPGVWVLAFDAVRPPSIPLSAIVVAGFCLALASTPLLACNRGFIGLRATATRRAHELTTAWLLVRGGFYFACVWLQRRLDAKREILLAIAVVCLALELATFTFALWRWLVAWSQTRDETWLRQSEIEGLEAANETRSRATARA